MTSQSAHHNTVPPALARRRNYSGPALFSYGFRPFFLFGATWAAAAILLWLPQYFGDIALPIAIGAPDWHAHEMIFGYVGAVAAGFLLTAIPNWTGRLPVNGVTLGLLVAVWAAGRLAMTTSAWVGLPLTALIDIAFLATLATVALREIVAGKNWRNLRVLAVLGLLIAGNIVFHMEIMARGHSEYGLRTGIAAVIALIMLVGGRIIPSFTRNWLVRINPGRLPAPFSRYDAICIAAGVAALLSWVAIPEHVVTGAALLLAGALHAIRLARWAGDRTVADRLVLVLHVAYAFIPLGFLLLGASILWPSTVPDTAGIHALMAGAAGLMTLAVMTRASLGHTGQALVASPATQAIYAFALLAALARIAAVFTAPVVLLYVAMFFWVAAFGLFVLVYAPPLLRIRTA
jgi:uncharacterized protein involved in response to NO